MSGVHLHLILSHVPVVGICIGVVLLLWGMVRRHDGVVGASLMLFVAMALAAAAAFLTGDPAEEVAERIAGVAKGTIDRHEDAATISSALAYIVGGASLLGLIIGRYVPRGRGATRIAVLVFAIIAAGSLVWTANLGGAIRHTELGGAASISGSLDHDD